ncbi:hypothetical protein HYT02_04220 [Candidatus Gottesmanbacteria bacterium]|nr:hypothetical protein [Candidatus Gottesmanbacteria bacterium]
MKDREYRPGMEVEPTNTKQVFEYLYPGVRYDKLPVFSIKNLKNTANLVWTMLSESFDAGLAFDLGEKYAVRYNFSNPDKLSMYIALTDLTPYQEMNSYQLMGFIKHLISSKEKLGGVGKKTIHWRPEYLKDQSYRTASLLAVGVQDPNNNPVGLIVFNKDLDQNADPLPSFCPFPVPG